jgi:hypothetical protein
VVELLLLLLQLLKLLARLIRNQLPLDREDSISSRNSRERGTAGILTPWEFQPSATDTPIHLMPEELVSAMHSAIIS